MKSRKKFTALMPETLATNDKPISVLLNNII